MALTRSKYCLKSFAEENKLVNLINELVEESNSAAFDMNQCRQIGHLQFAPIPLEMVLMMVQCRTGTHRV